VAFVRLPIVKATPLFPVTVMLPVPKANVRTFALLAKNVRDVRLKLLRLIIPCVNVNAPAKVGDPESDRVISALLTVQVEQAAVASAVTVAAVPLLLSNVTVSADVGADAPDAPPVVADQLAVLELFQGPVPPTQNLLATSGSLNHA
jgi:hypothetical protein